MSQKTVNGITTTYCEECNGHIFSNDSHKFNEHKKALHNQGVYATRVKSKKLYVERYGNKNAWIHFCKPCAIKLDKEGIIKYDH